MGNTNIYTQGHFISPNLIQKPQHKQKLRIDQQQIKLENIFGRMDTIKTTRAQKSNDTIVDDLVQGFSRVQYQRRAGGGEIRGRVEANGGDYKEEEEDGEREVGKGTRRKITQFTVLSDKNINHEIQMPVSRYIDQRKCKTDISVSRVPEKEDLRKYMTRNDSPVKQENKRPEQSKIQIFESRTQNKYFKLGR